MPIRCLICQTTHLDLEIPPNFCTTCGRSLSLDPMATDSSSEAVKDSSNIDWAKRIWACKQAAELKATQAESAIADRQNQIDDCESRIELLQKRLERLTIDKDKALESAKCREQERVGQLEAEIAQLQQTLHSTQTTTQQLQSDLQNQLSDRHMQIELLQRRLQQMTVDKDQAQEIARQLETETLQLKQLQSDLQNQLSDRHMQIELLQRRLQQMTVDKDQAQEIARQLEQKQIPELEATVAKLQHRLQVIEITNQQIEINLRNQALTELQSYVSKQDSSRTSQELESNNSPTNSEKDDAVTGTLDSVNQTRERFLDEKPIGLLGKIGISQQNEKTYNDLGKVLNWLDDIGSKRKLPISIHNIDESWEHTKAALDLISRLLKDREEYRRQLDNQDKVKRLLEREKFELEQINRNLQRNYDLQDIELRKITAERDRLKNTQQSYQKNIHNQYNQEILTLKQQKQSAEEKIAELEASRNKLLSEVASLKRNTGTHYDGTSDRPQHHILTGEYKTLKEQNLDPLADSLFKFIAAINPELKQQRREKVNDIKAAISAIVLIGGQAIMRGESTGSKELPSGMLDEMQNLLRQQLKLPNQNFLPQVSELLTKAANLAQGNVQCPVPSKWQEQDFQIVSAEMSDRLCRELTLNFTTLNQDIQTEMQKAIQNALRFLERAAIADPPAYLSLDNKGAPFRYDYHEAAKGYDEEGKIVKAIYPLYLVNSEAKVKGIVLTEPSTQLTPYTSPPCTSTETSSASALSPAALEQKSTENQVDETEKIRLDGKLEGKRETLIKNVKYKWIDTPDPIYQTSENEFLEKLSKINRLDIIEELEKEFHKVCSLLQFKEKVRDLLG